MNQIEKLDKILTILANIKSDDIFQEKDGYIMKDFCEKIKIELDDNEEKILEARLISDGYIRYPHDSFRIINITSKGIDFINTGGYKKLNEDNIKKQNRESIELQLMNSNLTTNKWMKRGVILSLILSIIAIIISIIK